MIVVTYEEGLAKLGLTPPPAHTAPLARPPNSFPEPRDTHGRAGYPAVPRGVSGGSSSAWLPSYYRPPTQELRGLKVLRESEWSEVESDLDSEAYARM